MAFSTSRPATNNKPPFKSEAKAAPAKPAPTPVPAPERSAKAPASRPDFVLKVKGEDGKFVRIGGMWTNEKGGFKITLDEGVEISSTATDRFKCFVFTNDYEKKN